MRKRYNLNTYEHGVIARFLTKTVKSDFFWDNLKERNNKNTFNFLTQLS